MSKVIEIAFRGGTYIVHFYSKKSMYPSIYTGIRKITQITGILNYSKELKDVIEFYNRSENYAGLDIKDFIRSMGY